MASWARACFHSRGGHDGGDVGVFSRPNDQLGGGLVGRERSLGFDDFAYLAINGFDGVGGVDDAPDGWRVGKE